MRNTFVKLFLALAMCFMIGSALVACGSTEVVLSVIDGEFAINGEKTGIKQGDRLDNCTHEVEEFEVKAHTADADGVVLEVCTKCDDYAKVKAGTIHNYVDGEIAATCTAAGFSGEICSICGTHGEGTDLKVAGHKWSEDIILTSVGSACEDGGVAVQHCSVCKAVSEPAAIGPVGHVVKTWVMSKAPSAEVGYVEGYCQYCYGYMEYELPALNDEDYSTSWKDNKAPTCYEEGTKVYTYVVKNAVNNEEENLWDKNIDVEVEALPAVAEHVIAGKPVSEWFDLSKGAYLYYADTNDDGKTEAVGFREAANSPIIACDDKGLAYFTCEACNYAVVNVNVYKAHFGAETIVEGKVAACHTPGVKKVACVNCLDVNPNGVEVAYTVDHSIEYELVKNGDAWDLVGKCHNKKVTVAATDTTPAVTKECWQLSADVRGYVFQEGVVAKKVGSTKSTCYAYGYDTYQCDVAVGAVTIPVKANVKYTEKPDHTLNGKLYGEYDEITTNTKGILPVAGGKFEVCGTKYDACYVCDVCAAYSATIGNTMGTLVVVNDIEMPHSDVVVESDKAKDPTCLVAGLEVVKCVNAQCPTKGVEREEVIAALGHDYVPTLDVNTKTNEITLKATCSRACKETFATVEATKALNSIQSALKEKTKTKATCTTLAVNSYNGTLAFKVVDAYGNALTDLENFKFDKDAEGNYIYNLVIEVAKEKTKGTGFEQSEKEYDFVAISYEKQVGSTTPHDWCDVEAQETTIFNRDWDKDGVIDAIETYTFKYCVDCYTAEQVSVEVEQLTDVTEAPKEEE